MIAVARPVPPSRTAVLAAMVIGGRAVLLFGLDLAECLARMIAPTLGAAVGLAVAVTVGQVLIACEEPVTAGYAVGALAVCIVAGLLAWAERRHRWWSP